MIRAVKYGAATGCKLPLALRWRIKKESPLLSGVSPSRLTEEISKIVHSSSPALIVRQLEAAGLYRYLQPNASTLMKENVSFREAYLSGFEAIVRTPDEEKPGWAMAALVRPYLETIADWNLEDPQEYYKTLFVAARRFVLPMNPPRVELDHAVRLIFAEHGLTVKHFRFPIRLAARPRDEEEGEGASGRSAAEGREASRRAPANETPATTAPTGEPPKKRRRRRKRKPAGGAETVKAPAGTPGSGQGAAGPEA
jgi:poly(A) polymerase